MDAAQSSRKMLGGFFFSVAPGDPSGASRTPPVFRLCKFCAGALRYCGYSLCVGPGSAGVPMGRNGLRAVVSGVSPHVRSGTFPGK